MKQIGNIVNSANLAQVAASGQRDADRESNRQREANTLNLWSRALAHSSATFGKRQLWRVVAVETKTSEMIIGSKGAPSDGMITQHPAKNDLATTTPIPIKYFVRRRLAKGRDPEWVEVVYDHVDPLDYDSPKAWSIRLSKEQKEIRG